MLVLNRGVTDRILIGDQIEIVVVQIRSRDVVRLGISAPPEVPILRPEVLARLREENPERRVRSLARRPDPDARIKRWAEQLREAACG